MKKKNILTFLIIFTISIVIFFPLLKGNLIADDYMISNLGYIEYIKKYSLNDGRIFCAILPIIFNALHIPIFAGKIICLLLGLIVSAITVVKLKNIIEKYKKAKGIIQEIIVTIISFVTIYNFFLIDVMMFIDAPIIVASILIYISVADSLVTNEKHSFIKSAILTVIATFSYQGTITVLLAMTLLFSILKNKNNIKGILIDIGKCILIIGIVVILNFSYIKLYGLLNNIKTRPLNNKNILNNIWIIFNTIGVVLISNINFYYNGMFLTLIITIISISLIYGIKFKMQNSFIIKIFSIISFFIICSTIMFVFIISSFYTGRTRIPLGMTIGALLIFLYIETKVFESNKLYTYTIMAVLVLYLLTTISYYEKIIYSKKNYDKINIEYAKEAINYVNEYENETGKKVTNIMELALLNHQEYTNILGKLPYSDINSIILRSASAMINYYSNYRFANCNYTVAKEYGRPGSYYCNGDTLYIYICIW